MKAALFVGALVAHFLLWSASAGAQTVTQRGFVDGRVWFFPEVAPNDDRRDIYDALLREEVFVEPARWIEFAAGVDVRANSYGQVEDEWRLDVEDRGVLRPRIALRRLAATVRSGGFLLDVGKQFIRWGRADILNPIDRFVPRDFMNVFDSEFLPVIAAKAAWQIESETIEGVWTPQMTPSRLPRFDQRWTVLPAEAADINLVDGGSRFPTRGQYGLRWSHAGRVDFGLSYFNGFYHLPRFELVTLTSASDVQLTRTYSDLESYGGDGAIPTGWFTLKGEAAYFTSPSSTSEEYVLYVVEIERLVGEWVLAAGYAGEVVTHSSEDLPFSPERGLARSIVGHASYTVNPRVTATIETAVRTNLEGMYVKGEYSETAGEHWRVTLSGVGIAGDDADFIGQYHHNSYVSAALRYSF